MESFAQSSDGVVLVADGIDAVLRWDGYSTTATPAGVDAPAAAISLAGSGSGSITGTYYAFVRYVDSHGNVSNLSPISNPATLTANSQVDYSGLPTPAQATVVRRQIIRNTDGSIGATDPVTGLVRNIAYVDVDTTDLFSITLSSTRLDADLRTQEQVDVDAAAFENGTPPSFKPFLIWHQNFMWLFGVENYREGSCLVTFNSVTVQGYQTEWRQTMAGRFFYTANGNQTYEISAVDETNQTLTLTTAYTGPTDQRSEYAIKPDATEVNAFQWSQPNGPEQWDPRNKLFLPEDGDRVTGAFNYGSYLYVLKTRHMYRLIVRDDPANDARIFLACNRGAVNDRVAVTVDETAYLLDQGGVYAYKGDDQGVNVSTQIQDMFTGQPGSGRKINWSAARYFHGCHSPKEEVVRWFVSLAGDYVPRHAIVYAYKQEKWTTEFHPRRAGASVLGKIGGSVGTVAEPTEQYFVGSTGGSVFAPKGSSLDGDPSGGTVRGRATSAGWLSLTDVQAAFTSGVVNCPIAITGGKGRGQLRLITAATASRLTLNMPWRIKPDDTSTYCVGGVAFTYSSQRLRWVTGDQQMGRGFELEWQPNTVPNRVRVGFAPDFSDPMIVAWDVDRGFRIGVKAKKGDRGQDIELDTKPGYDLVQMNAYREPTTPGQQGRTVRVVMSGVANEEPVRMGTAILTGAAG